MVSPEIHPKTATTVSVSKFAEHLLKMIAQASRVHEGYAMVGESGASLDVTIQEGVAFIKGKQVGRLGEGGNTLTLSSTPNATNYIYLQDNAGTGVVSSNTTGVLPNYSILLWTIQTNSGGTGMNTGTKTDKRDGFRLHLDEGLIVEDLELDGADPAIRKVLKIEMEGSQPYVRLRDTATGNIIRLWARSSKLQVTDDAGTVLTDDLANLALTFSAISGTISDAQHGSRGGGSLHANATGGAAGFMSAADKTILDAATDVATASTLAKRDAAGRLKVVDGSVASDAATKGQVDTVNTALTNHKAAGGSEHPVATTGAAGFMSAADKTKLDGSTSAATNSALVQRDASGRAQVAAPSAAADIARKDTVDTVQTNLNTHTGTETAGVHGSTVAATASKIPHRDADSISAFGSIATFGDEDVILPHVGYTQTNAYATSASSDADGAWDNGQLTSQIWKDSGNNTKATILWRYDSGNGYRLSKKKITIGATVRTITYSYDGSGRVSGYTVA